MNQKPIKFRPKNSNIRTSKSTPKNGSHLPKSPSSTSASVSTSHLPAKKSETIEPVVLSEMEKLKMYLSFMSTDPKKHPETMKYANLYDFALDFLTEFIKYNTQNILFEAFILIENEIASCAQASALLGDIDDSIRRRAVQLYLDSKGLPLSKMIAVFQIDKFDDPSKLVDEVLSRLRDCSVASSTTIFSLFHQLNLHQYSKSIVEGFLVVFFKFGHIGSIQKSFSCFNPAIKKTFFTCLDQLLVDSNCLSDQFNLNFQHSFLEPIQMIRAIKKYFNKVFKEFDQAKGEEAWLNPSIVPNFVETSNFDSARFMINTRYRPTAKNTLSKEAFFELSMFLVAECPIIHDRFVQSLSKISEEDASDWEQVYQRMINDLPLPALLYDLSAYCESFDSQRYYAPTDFDFVNKVVWVDTEADFESMVDFLSKRSMVALDTEWLPCINYARTNIAILQIASSSKVFLVDIHCFAKLLAISNSFKQQWSRFIDSVFNNAGILKVGFSVIQDLGQLSTTMGVPMKMSNCIDFHDYNKQIIHKLAVEYSPNYSSASSFSRMFASVIERCKAVHEDIDSSRSTSMSYGKLTGVLPHQGLSLLSYAFLGKPLYKEERMSNWERRPLRAAQIHYAACDVFCLIEIYNNINRISRRVMKMALSDFLYAVKHGYHLVDGFVVKNEE